MPVANSESTTDDTSKPVIVKGPDNKIYKMPSGTTKEKALLYFKTKGIKAPEKNTTNNKSETKKLGGAGGDYIYDPAEKLRNPASHAGGVISDIGHQALNQAPNAGGLVGSLVGGGKGPGAIAGAGLGGGAGEALKQIGTRLLFDEGPTSSKEAAWKIIKESAIQAGLQKGGEVAGEAFFKILNKIPHSSEELIKAGGKNLKIPLLPGDVKGGVMKYVEQFLSAYLPSASVMKEFTDRQTTSIKNVAETIAGGMSKFKGDPEQFGKLLQDSINVARKTALASLKAKAGSMTKIAYDKELDKIESKFLSGFMGKILHSNNVEQLAGTLISKGVGNEEVRGLISELTKIEKFDVFKAARTSIMGQVIKKTLTSKVDPAAAREGVGFAGKEFSNALNMMERGRFETIFTPKEVENIHKFEKIISGVGGQAGFVGKFANLVFVLGRGLSSVQSVTKLAGGSLLAKTMAKIITSDTGLEAYSAYARAIGQNLPRATKAAIDVLKTEIKKAKDEYDIEQKQIEEENNKGVTK
jgi:hypothetical protein